MERDELIHRISVGSAYLQRPGLTEEQIYAAKAKVAMYQDQLREMDANAIKPPTKEDEERAATNIAKIREMLDGAKPRRRAL